MKKMNVRPGSTAIDLCCGTCDWTISLAEASGTGAMVGLDFSQNMLDVGREKIQRLGLDKQIRLVRGNAMELPFEDNTFDYATIGFALRNVPDLVKVIEEMQRVVKPGAGRFAGAFQTDLAAVQIDLLFLFSKDFAAARKIDCKTL